MDIRLFIGAVAVMTAVQRGTPTPPQPPTPPDPGPASGKSVSSYVLKDEGRELTVRTVGQVTFDPDRDPLLTLSKDARVEVIERVGGVTRRLVQTADKVIWSIDSIERPFDAEARAWLEHVLRSPPRTPTTQPPSGR